MSRRCGSVLVLLLLQVFIQGQSLLTSTFRRAYHTCPAAMRSINYKPDASLFLETDTPMPKVQEGDILIKVAAAGVNRLDLLQASGRYPPPPGASAILGVEVAGIVEELSDSAQASSGLKIGDRVMALIGGGGYAEYCTAPYQCVMPIPEGVDFRTAAGIPEVFATAYQALVVNAGLKDGDRALVHAGASGVGIAAIQLVRVLARNTTVLTTSSSAEKLAVCQKYGADVLINYKESDFSEEVLRFTDNQGADLIIDFVGASYWERNIKSAAVDGRIVLLGLLGGAVTEGPLNLGVLLRKRLTIRGSTLRSRTLDYKDRLISEMKREILPLFSSGKLQCVIDSCFPIERAQEAHDLMRSNTNIGKIILTL